MVLLSCCLFFCQFQLGVAYKSDTSKKKRVCKNLNRISQESVYIKSLFTENGVYLGLEVKHPLT